MISPRSISFFVSGTPKGQPRPKAFARRFGDKWQARVYDPGTAEEWKSQIALAAKPHLSQFEPGQFAGPVFLRIECFFPRPKNHFRSNGELKGNAPTYVTTKPDFDNTAKAISDALTQLGFWKDDSQIVAHAFVKRYAVQPFETCECGAQITIRELGVEQVEAERLLEL